MTLIETGIFSTFALIPGFLCMYVLHKISGYKIRLSNLELTLLSLLISFLIFVSSLFTYQAIHLLFYDKQLIITNLSYLILNLGFFLIAIVFTIIFFFIGILFIKYDVFYPLRKWLTGQDFRIKTNVPIWDSALNKHYGFAVVETKTDSPTEAASPFDIFACLIIGRIKDITSKARGNGCGIRKLSTKPRIYVNTIKLRYEVA